MGNYVYLRINKKTKEIEFHEEYSSAMAKKGLIKKFDRHDRYEMRKRILQVVGNLTEAELERWTAPTWVKTWLKKRMPQNLYITQVGNEIFYKFQSDIYLTVINKRLYPFDIDYYIYHLLLQIAEFHDISVLHVFTDIVDLLRINKLNYNPNKPNNLIIKLVPYKILEEHMGG